MRTRLISWLLIHGFFASPGQQQQLYWLQVIIWSLSSTGRDVYATTEWRITNVEHRAVTKVLRCCSRGPMLSWSVTYGPGACITTGIWRCRKPFSQWKQGCNWLKVLRQRHVAVVIKGLGRVQRSSVSKKNRTNESAMHYKKYLAQCVQTVWCLASWDHNWVLHTYGTHIWVKTKVWKIFEVGVNRNVVPYIIGLIFLQMCVNKGVHWMLFF